MTTPPSDGPAPARLLVALASPAEAEVLLPWAHVLAAALRVPLTLVYALDPGRQREEAPIAAAMAADYLALVATDPRLAGLAVDTRVQVGLREEELPRIAAERPGTLLMMPGGERGGVTRTLLGSTTESVIHAFTTPFIILPPHAVPPATIKRIVVGTDRSALAEAVLRAGRPLAGRLGVDVVSVEAIEPDSRPGYEFLAVEPVMTEGHIVLRGHAGPTILAVARARDAALIVVGSHGAGGLTQRLLGSTADWLARHADRPVLIVPEAQGRP